MTRVLFVCLGNICRSPAAEGVFRKLVENAGLKNQFEIDSAGTGAWHVGDPPDARMIEHAKARGYDLTSIEARQFDPSMDFKKFDYILTMDDSNFHTVKALDRNSAYHAKVQKMVSFCKIHSVPEVPDPYYKAGDGFEHVLDILEDSCSELLSRLKEK